MRGCNRTQSSQSYTASKLSTRLAVQRCTTQSTDVTRSTQAACTQRRKHDACIKACSLAAQFSQRRGAEAAVAAVLLFCGSAALPSPTVATTLAPDTVRPTPTKSIDRVPMLRFKHSCMPQLPASSHVDSDGALHDGQAQTIQVGRRLQERFRVAPPVCSSLGGGDIVVRPKGFSQSLPTLRFAADAAPSLLNAMPAALPIASLPTIMFSVSDDNSAAAALPEKYVPSPMEMTWQIYVGSAVATFPFVIGAYEFGKRILIQQRCETCNGIGLVKNTRGTALLKCADCGGFFPWLGWKTFFTSTASPGNGGPLLQPKGQTSILYKVPPKPPAQQPSSRPSVASLAAARQPSSAPLVSAQAPTERAAEGDAQNKG